MLGTELRVRLPAGIEENEERADVVFRGDGEEDVDSITKAFGILLPKEVVEEDAHGVHAEALGPAELEVDAFGIEGVGLPHFELIDGVGGNVVAADKPGLMSVPFVRLGFGPSRRRLVGGRLCWGGESHRREKRGGRAQGEASFHSAPRKACSGGCKRGYRNIQEISLVCARSNIKGFSTPSMNIREVARLAKVSTATVSRTINGSDKVTPETKERVQRAIEELKFYPNTWARALGSGRSSLYGLIISDITNPFFPELVKSFEDIAVQYGQEVLVANTNYDSERMELCVSRMLQRKVDGVAIMTSEMDERWIREFNTREIPLVFLDTGTAHDLTSNISVDYAAGVGAAVEHIVGLGHTEIAFISGPMMLRSARVRREAFVGCLKSRGIGAGLMEEGNHQASGGHEAMARLLSGETRPTAVLASNDMTAIGALGAIHERGLRVPEDISIVGFDDIQISAFTQPALTTVGLSRDEIARVAFRALYSSRQDGARGGEYAVQPALVVRRSTGPAPGKGEFSGRR